MLHTWRACVFSYGALAEYELESAVTLFGKTFQQIESVLAPGRDYLGNQSMVIGVSASIWAFAGFAIFLGMRAQTGEPRTSFCTFSHPAASPRAYVSMQLNTSFLDVSKLAL
jgi:hypothetical protein